MIENGRIRTKVRKSYSTAASGALTSAGERSTVREGAKVIARNSQSGIADAVTTAADSQRQAAAAAGAVQGNTAQKTNAAINQLGVKAGQAGTALLVVSGAASAYNIAAAPEGQRGRTAAGEAGAWLFGVPGAAATAKVGFAIGLLDGPVGAGVGAVGGALLGGYVFGSAGKDVGISAYDELNQ